MAKLYASKADIEDYLLLNIDNSFNARIDKWIEAVSNHITLLTNRVWLADDEPSARFYNGNGCQGIEIDDFIGTPTVEIGEDFATNFSTTTNFILYPYNTTQKNTIILKEDVFPKGKQNIRITAKWGYLAEVPEDIRFATTVLASGIVLAQTNQDGEIESEKIGNYQVKYKDESHRNDSKQAMDIITQRRVMVL
jgi:hypothetical protein